MSKFRYSDFKVQTDPSLRSTRVVKVEQGIVAQVENFQIPTLYETGKGDYSVVRSKFGSLAQTDDDRSTRDQKDRRFNLSQLVRTHLAVDQEERRALDERVNEKLNSLAEETRTQAAEQGYHEGLKMGFDEAQKEFRAKSLQRIQQLENLVLEFEGAKQLIFKTNERFLIDLVYRISKMILIKELSMDREYIFRLVEELVQRLEMRENITIKINPEDAQSIEMLKGSIEKSFGPMRNLSLEISNQVKLGGCLIETDWNAIDASLETQMREIYEALLGKNSVGNSA